MFLALDHCARAHDGLDRPFYLYAGATGIAYAAYTPSGAPQAIGHNGFTTFGYDGIQRRASLSHGFAGNTGNVAWSFARSPAGQITAETRDNDAYAWAGHYALSRPYTTNGLNQYMTAGGATFGYDPNGNLTGDGANAFVYDVENRLVSASGAHHARLDYDPLGRLWQVTDTQSGAVTRFLYDGDALVADYDGAGAMTHRYAHWAGADTPMAAFDGAGLSAIHHMLADHEGSIVALADGAGALVATNSYDEYGIPGVGNTGRFQYTGQAWLAELGMYYYKARIYSPTLGRFLQTDPIGYADQFNLYAYVGDDPINRSDPRGLQEVYIYPDGSRHIIYTLDLTGPGAAYGLAMASAARVASEIHTPAGERPVSVEIQRVPDLLPVPDTRTFDLSPGPDYANIRNGQGEGINLDTRMGHLDSNRWDLGAALMHDIPHPGVPGVEAVEDEYKPSLDAAGHVLQNVPPAIAPGFEHNIMGTTLGRELNNHQVDQIEKNAWRVCHVSEAGTLSGDRCR